jgi:hypothetical protein
LTCLPFPLIPHLLCFPTLLLNLAVGTMEDNKCGNNDSEYWCQKRDALKLKMYRYLPAPYMLVTADWFPGGKAAGAWSWPLTSV